MKIILVSVVGYRRSDFVITTTLNRSKVLVVVKNHNGAKLEMSAICYLSSELFTLLNYEIKYYISRKKSSNDLVNHPTCILSH